MPMQELSMLDLLCSLGIKEVVMDLYAYSQIDKYIKILEDKHISIPRLRGIRCMKNEELITNVDIENCLKQVCFDSVIGELENDTSGERFHTCTLGKRYRGVVYGDKKYESVDGKIGVISDVAVGVDWNDLPMGRLNLVVSSVSSSMKLIVQSCRTFNKYVGKENIYCVHCRIGGDNWKFFGGPKLRKKPWFLCKVDSVDDSTYCDVYVDVSKVKK